jgi:hypothetical protein
MAKRASLQRSHSEFQRISATRMAIRISTKFFSRLEMDCGALNGSLRINS